MIAIRSSVFRSNQRPIRIATGLTITSATMTPKKLAIAVWRSDGCKSITGGGGVILASETSS